MNKHQYLYKLTPYGRTETLRILADVSSNKTKISGARIKKFNVNSSSVGSALRIAELARLYVRGKRSRVADRTILESLFDDLEDAVNRFDEQT